MLPQPHVEGHSESFLQLWAKLPRPCIFILIIGRTVIIVVLIIFITLFLFLMFILMVILVIICASEYVWRSFINPCFWLLVCAIDYVRWRSIYHGFWFWYLMITCSRGSEMCSEGALHCRVVSSSIVRRSENWAFCHGGFTCAATP
jgi:hypothetical protein